eukprot:CAMPEP_0168321306 /NCGR_PEP_ID=MMETSP0213-20121227/2193_1 /TAXON_ID=151035 /ORGANISM="Euplotes harpa, Strain FSP1.4" /LENGTH=297 /DNA_ID=CAMNT_0008322933 /DNA_START=120 /DNA_END=1013 /DNA_ORIENTATION=-
MAKTFNNPRPLPEVSQSQQNPLTTQIGDYGDSSVPVIGVESRPNNRYPVSEDQNSKLINHRSMENLPPRPREKENSNLFNNEYNEYNAPSDRYQKPFSYQPRPFNEEFSQKPGPNAKTSMSSDSRDSLNLNRSRRTVDWAHTSIYQEYCEEGVTKYNYKKFQSFFQIYKLLKSRYPEYSQLKAVEPFFLKAMDTLGEILGSFSVTHLYRAIQQIYSKTDIQNTLKLVIRLQTLFKARYLLFDIFRDIHEFKKVEDRVSLLLSLNDKREVSRTYRQLRLSLDELNAVNSSLQANLNKL